MAGPRGAIKVGTGYISIEPHLGREALARMRTALNSTMGRAGRDAGTAFGTAMSRGFTGLTREATTAARAMQRSVSQQAKQGAKERAAVHKAGAREYAHVEEELTRSHGVQVAARVRKALEAAERQTTGLSTESRKALRVYQRHLADMARADREIHQDQTRMERERRQQIAETARRERQAQEEAQLMGRRRLQAERLMLTELSQARRASLHEELAAAQIQAQTLRNSIQGYRRELRQLDRATAGPLAHIQGSLKTHSETFHVLGQSATEAGALVTRNLLGPLSLVSAALTEIGVKNADMRIMGQMGMHAAGVSQQASSHEMERLQKYAIDTPFSMDLMHEYQMKMVRGMVAREKGHDSKDPAVRRKAADRAASRTSDVIEAVLDSMARAGNLSESQQQRSLYAIDKIMDLDRAPTKNFKQFIDSTGMPAQEMAQLLSFKNADRMYAVMGTPAAKGGGITGQQVLDALMKNWEGSGTDKGSKGYGRKVGTATITGRLQQMRERASYEMGQLFATKDPKTGAIKYTGLGEKIMGKQNKKGEYEGGLLNDVKDIAKASLPHVKDVLVAFFDVLGTFTGWLKRGVDFLNSHPQLQQAALKFVKIAAVATPFLIGFGVLSKLFGKLGKIMAPSLGLARGFVGGLSGAGKVLRQIKAGRQSRKNGGTFRQGYRDRRTELRGDNRGMGRRAWDRTRGRDSRATEVRVRTGQAEQSLRQLDERIRELRQDLRGINDVSLAPTADGLGGTSRRSVASSARDADERITGTSRALRGLGRERLGGLQADIRQTGVSVSGLKDRVEATTREVKQLGRTKLVGLRIQFDMTEGSVQDVKDKVQRAASEVSALSRKKLDALRKEFAALRSSVVKAKESVDTTGARVASLNRRSLASLRGQVDKVTHAADDAYKKVGQGTGAGSLAGRIGLLNTRSLKSVTSHVHDLAQALKGAEAHAKDLDSDLGKVSKRAPGGGSGSSGGGGGKKRPTRRARGGVLPGYAPWVDSVPAILSPGESVLRPEVTSALGEETINAWNQAAVRGQVSRHARGGVVGRLGLDTMRDMIRERGELVDIGRVTADTMQLDGSSDRLGGPVQDGILRTGDNTSQWAGRESVPRFRGMYDWITNDSWQMLRRVPTGVGQVAGIIGGAFAPTLADYFWNDVWQGRGNIVQRGNRFMADTFSLKTLTSVTGDLFGGLWDTVTSLVGGAKDIITDPIGSVTDSFGAIWDLTADGYNQLIGMVGVARDIKDAPLEYAGRVFHEWLANAKEAMPNTEGLFDFSGSNGITAKRPDFDAALTGGPAPAGGAVTRWKPTVQRVLKELGLATSYTDLILRRIEVESGGNPTAINNWDINAKNGVPSQGLMQTIPPTFAAYAGPYRMLGITNPLASIYAGINYATHRYGANWPRALSGNKGYWMGTQSATAGLAMVGEHGPELVNFRGGERVHNSRETKDMVAGRRYEIHIHEAKAENTTDSVLRAMRTAEVMAGF
ncbi:transglycosylase SLT domain-containing protein [Streptomyces sp. NPDC048644]|uniref:transglycosylase SLT domain-containing protein n=1 Tax=Streptomyces sp. NPDC048644 TaxID=3365582 RepID=UPI0037195B98